MLSTFNRTMRRLAGQNSGNAVLLVAAGLPALIGAAGLGVDTAQWYMWKREMQYAADQAALAGAWAKVGGVTGDGYKTRVTQELNSNLSQVSFISSTTIATAPWPVGNNQDNSVIVTVSGTKRLPFSSFLTNSGVTIAARSQATYQAGRTFTSCLIAVDPHTKGAITIGGNAYVVAGCGAAALSDSPDAVIKNGGAVFDVGWIVSAGGIDSGFDDGKTQIYENQTGLQDPFANLTPPTNNTPQTLTCSNGGTVYTATVAGVTKIYSQAMTSKNGNSWKTNGAQTLTSQATSTTTQVVNSSAKVGDQTTSSNTVTGTVTQSGSTYNRNDVTTTVTGTIQSIAVKVTPAGAYPQPGTYSDFTISCDTVMAKGVYVINGGLLSINAQNSLTGNGVMFVLTNGAGIRINGGSNVFLRPMSYDEMVDPSAGNMTSLQATRLKDMLIFEDRNSSGDNNDKINGNSGMGMNGTVYLPSSTLTFNGTANVTLGCFVIAAGRIVIQGTANMTSFCQNGGTNTGVVVGGGANTVRLVS
ncbi:MAG: hypothetical protein JSR28_18095 [Proteobacteria bacterium]|nr:hypothetical protein [Pseudomonadota bacterium]